jgi:phage tail-like protein
MSNSAAFVGHNDPYENFRFKVKWDGQYVAGVSKVTGLRRTTDVVEYREGGIFGRSSKLVGKTKYDPITLERGVTQDRAFEDWANAVVQFGTGVGLPNFRKDITIDLFDEAGRHVLSYRVYRCWVAEYQAISDLDSSSDGTLIEHIKLENEGWERDESVVPPPEPA